MAEKLYTIPVNDGFSRDCECPLCEMYKELEESALEYTLGPSYMEDDVREMTDAAGFCKKHVKMMYEKGNRLGMALMYETHVKKIMRDMKSLEPVKGTMFKKANDTRLKEYVCNLEESCFVCDRIEATFKQYVHTIVYLWNKDGEFREKLEKSKGFCIEHYQRLVEQGISELSGSRLNEFLDTVNKLFYDNLSRVYDDLSWFIKKFDYRYEKESWKNSKDAVKRMVEKINGRTDIENVT